jgi:hypothetical protein
MVYSLRCKTKRSSFYRMFIIANFGRGSELTKESQLERLVAP